METIVHILSFSLLLFAFCQVASGIDCFRCVSVNGNNPACEDPSTITLQQTCWSRHAWEVKGERWTFPASACIKLAGVYDDTGETVVVRGCELDSGTLTTDTEITRMSHCGSLFLEGRYVKGCLQSCDDVDGCNSSPNNYMGISLFIAIGFLLLIRCY